MVADAVRQDGKEKAKAFFEEMLTRSFREVSRVLVDNGIAVIVFAHKTTAAWETIINALLDAGLFMTASWPIHTEMQARLNAQETASLASSVYMVCRKRTTNEVGEFPKVRKEIEERVKRKLDQFWDEGIRGADFFMSAIGPAVEVFGKYARVEKLSGDPVSIQELLDYIRKVVNDFAVERILHSGYAMRGIDATARFYLLYRWAYNHSRVHFDEARKLAQSTGLELGDYWDENGFVRKEGEYIRVLNPLERTWNSHPQKQHKVASPQLELPFDENAAYEPIRGETMVDVLHKAVQLWAKNAHKALNTYLDKTYGNTEAFWRVAQAVADVLPEGDKEKQLLQGLLYRQNGFATGQVRQVRAEYESQQYQNVRKRGSR
jgi:adenine-specific DNA methylase